MSFPVAGIADLFSSRFGPPHLFASGTQLGIRPLTGYRKRTGFETDAPVTVSG